MRSPSATAPTPAPEREPQQDLCHDLGGKLRAIPATTERTPCKVRWECGPRGTRWHRAGPPALCSKVRSRFAPEVLMPIRLHRARVLTSPTPLEHIELAWLQRLFERA